MFCGWCHLFFLCTAFVPIWCTQLTSCFADVMVKRDNKCSPHVQLDCLYNAYLLFLGCQFGLFAGGRVGLHKFAFFLA